MSTSRKIKASSVSVGPTEPPSKRQKQVPVNSKIEPYLFFNHLCGILEATVIVLKTALRVPKVGVWPSHTTGPTHTGVITSPCKDSVN